MNATKKRRLFLAGPTVCLESERKSECTENGDCLEIKAEIIHEDKRDCHNDTTKEPLMYYSQNIDEFGNIIGNASVVDIKNLLKTLTEKHNSQDKIEKEVATVFRGVIVAVILFGVCACLCVVTACIYCCRINITDNRLKNDVEALAEKLKRDCKFKKSMKKSPREPVSESCNIIVEDAGVFVV
ncbi:uncharacterized protein [Epargyreus clarus]|uniref:uncharacterized protein isoform X2 n=1 Tax=Epargyreus clarus TaxID=520877 RepID=UPI003C2BB3BB